ncbi:MAG: peptidoglycan DD-metalloendopeptidase family protein [Clostridiales bacterium]
MSNTFKLVIYPKSGNPQNVTDICTDIKWSTERAEAPGSLDITLAKDSILNFQEGDAVQFAIDNVFKFRGYVFAKDKDEKGIIKVKIYDQIRYLKAKQSYNFSGQKASDIIKKIAGDFGLTCGEIADTQYVIPSMVCDDKSCIDIITNALEKTSVGTDKIFIFYDDCGRLALKFVGDLETKYVIGDKSEAISYNYKTSIDDEVYNYIKLVRPNSDTGQGDVYAAMASNLISTWGFLQYYKKVDENYTPAQIKQLAKDMLKYYAQKRRTLNIKCFGNPNIKAGNVVYFDIAELGDIKLERKLLVEKAVHNITAKSYTMDLSLTVMINEQIIFNELAAEEYVAVEKKETQDSISALVGSGSGSGGDSGSGRTVPAVYTAYYPANNKMEGGFYDCKGKKLNPANNTCAAPKSVPYGTKIKMLNTGKSRDGQIYTVNDVGSAINIVKGVYHFDILMSNKKDCDNWGRVNGKAIIYDGKGDSGGSSGTKLGYSMPYHGKFRTSTKYGKKGTAWSCGWHTGVDYVGTSNKNVYAIASGTVIKTATSGSYGKHVLIKHDDGMVSLYAHLDGFSVMKGQKVNATNQVGIEGHTGNANGSHLHLELHKGSYKYAKNCVDPDAYIKSH